MNIVALGQQKGGVGKSAAAINLACQAAASGAKTALVDLDADQGTAARWGKRRGNGAPDVRSSDAYKLPGLLAELRAAGVEWVFLDLPGRSAPVASAGMTAAELVIIPTRPLDIDVEASFSTAQAVRRAGRPYAYLINIAPPQVNSARAKAATEALRKAGHAVCPVVIIQRIQVADAMAAGQGANEIEPGGTASEEFAALFRWLKKEIAK